MASSPTAPRLTLPVVLIGPRARGRNYGLLRQSPGVVLSPPAEALLSDFSLALASWADRGLPGFAAMFPLDEAHSVLVRARYFGEAGQGAVATAACAILSEATMQSLDACAHRLLAGIIDPGADNVGEADLQLAPMAEPLGDQARYAGSGAGWRDTRVVAAGASPEQLLGRIIDAVEPAAQRARIGGWATTASLPLVGRFVPADLFRLVVHEESDGFHAADLPHAVIHGGPSGLSSAPAPPLSYLVWMSVQQFGQLDPVLARALSFARWDRSYAGIDGGSAAAIGLIEACLELGVEARIRLLKFAAGAAIEARGELGEALDAGIGQVINRIVHAEPQTALSYLSGLIGAADPSLPFTRKALANALVQGEVLTTLPERTFQSLAEAGLLDGLADAPERLEALPRPRLLRALHAALAQASGDPAARRLASVLLARAAEVDATTTGQFAAAVIGLLTLPSNPEADVELAVSSIVDLTPLASLPLLSQRAIRPALRRRDAYFPKALAAALRAEARLGAAP